MVLYNWRPMVFLLALIVYGGFSAPTPDQIGAAEIFIAILVLTSIGTVHAVAAFIPARHEALFIQFSRLMFLYVLLTPLFVGIILNESGLNYLVRDIIPLLYMFVFIFFYRHSRKSPKVWLQACAYGLTAIGVMFSIRFFIAGGVDISQIGRATFFGDDNYFPVSPAVTFCAIFCVLEAFRCLENGRLLLACLYSVFWAIALLALAGILLRAPLILFFLVFGFRVLVLESRGILSKIAKMLVIGSVIYFAQFVIPVINLIYEKFDVVGSNGKVQELQAVFAHLTGSVRNLVLGVGWGGGFVSPIFGIEVRYTHQLVSYLSLKVGVVGLIYGLILVLRVVGRSSKILFSTFFHFGRRASFEVSIVGAGLVSLASPFFLQASYKSLDFGVVLFATMLAQDVIMRSKVRKGSHRGETESEILAMAARA